MSEQRTPSEMVFAAGAVMAERLDKLEAAVRKVIEVTPMSDLMPCSRWPACGYIGCDMKAGVAKAWKELKEVLDEQ